MQKGFKFVILLLAVYFLLSPRPLFARDTGLAGFNNQLFRPRVDGYGLYNTSAAEVLPHLTYSAGFYVNFAKDLLSVVMPARQSSIKSVDNNLTADFQAAVGLFDFVDVGLNLPIVFYIDGTNFNDLSGFQTAALGDIRLDAKFQVLKDQPRSLGLALLSGTTFPTGSRAKFTGDKGLTWEGRLVLDKDFQWFSLFANMGYRFVNKTIVRSTVIDDRLTFSGGAAIPIPVRDRSWSFLAEVAGEAIASDIKKSSTPIEVLGGVRKTFNSGLTLDLGGGGGIIDAFGASDFRLFAGISYSPARRLKVNLIDHIVYFGFDKYNVRKSDHPRLKEIGRVMTENPDKSVVLSGHADDRGEAAYNLWLSRKRAEEVQKHLIRFGAPKDQLKVEALGEERPASPDKTREGRGKNRRVEIRGD